MTTMADKQSKLTPQQKNSRVEFQMKYYDGADVFTDATTLFEGVIAVDV